MPQGELLHELELLYRAAGRPSYRRISNEIRRQHDMPDTVSHETVGSILRGDLARWSKVECVVRQLALMAVHRPDPDDEVRRFHALWSDAVDAQRDTPLPPTPDDPPAPPAPPAIPVDSPPSAPAGAPAGMPTGSAPERNLGFTGRRDLLQAIVSGLDGPAWQPLILYGLGGVGKTQLAAEFLHRNARLYDFVWWITAEDPSQATAALATLGERQEWPVSFDLAQTVQTVLTRLESGSSRWLIVYDNAGSPDEIRPLLPQAGGHLLVTTRDAAWLEMGRPVEVDVFTRAESIELLCGRGHEISFDEADQLAERLGDLPLALEQVAAMQSTTRTPVPDYLRELDERALPLLKSAPPGGYRTTVVTAFTVAVDRVRAESAATAQLLELVSCLAAEPISLALLRTGGKRIPPPLGRLLEQPDVLDEAVWRLRRYGLTKLADDGQALQVHRLVQAIVRDSLTPEGRKQAFDNARKLLIAANPGRPADPLTWDMCARIGPHLRPSRMTEATEPDARQILIDHASYLYEFGDFEGSRRLSEDAPAAWASHDLGNDMHEFACLRRLAAALYALGRYPEARRRATEGWDRMVNHPEYGPEHLAALDLADSLAVLHRVSGAYAKALELDQMIADVCRRVRGENAIRTLQARNNLAASLRAVGDFRTARDIDAELVEVQRTALEPEHHWTLLSVSNLARDLYGLGEYSAALALQRTTWAAHRARLGDRHPHVLAAWRTIVLSMRKAGQLGPALDEGLRLYLICQAHLGTGHELTLAAMMTYANTLCTARDTFKAWHLAADALDRYRRAYGERNPLTLAAATNQAIILRALGERRRARHVGEASFRLLRQSLGADHPYTISAAIGTGNDLVLAHESDTARRLLAGTLEDARRIRGESHPDTLICAVNLGLLLATGPSGRRDLLDSAVDGLRRVFGAEHPFVATASSGRPLECDVEPPPV